MKISDIKAGDLKKAASNFVKALPPMPKLPTLPKFTLPKFKKEEPVMKAPAPKSLVINRVRDQAYYGCE
jgi:hypothetical protein